MDCPERQLIDSLRRSLLERQGVINSQLGELQKYERNLIKRFQRKQKQQHNRLVDEASAFISRHKEDMGKLIRIRVQLRERLSTIEFKLAELKRKQII